MVYLHQILENHLDFGLLCLTSCTTLLMALKELLGKYVRGVAMKFPE